MGDEWGISDEKNREVIEFLFNTLETMNGSSSVNVSLPENSYIKFEARWLSVGFSEIKSTLQFYKKTDQITIEKNGAQINLDVCMFPLELVDLMSDLKVGYIKHSEPKIIPALKNPTLIETKHISGSKKLVDILKYLSFSVEEKDVFQNIKDSGEYVVYLSEKDLKKSQKLESSPEEDPYEIVFKQ